MTRAAREALAARCEAAQGPCPVIDTAIMLAVYPDLGLRQCPDGYWYSASGIHTRVEEYTASLDAAASLVPEGMFWRMASELAQAMIVRRSTTGHPEVSRSGLCHTPALALCAAALRAMEARDA